MTSEDQEKSGEGSAPGDWMKSMVDFWLSAAGLLHGVASASQGSDDAQSTARDDFKTRTQEAWQQPLKVIQALIANFGDPEAFSTFVKGSGAFPDIMMRMIRSGYDGYSQLYQQWVQRLGKIDRSGEPYRFENLDEDLFRAWMEIYQREIQPILNAPQMGLNRFYLERMNQTIDQYNLHQAALADFMRLLFLPMEKSLRVMEKEMEKLATEGKLSENFKDYYHMWIKVLEGHYMTLFKSPDYLNSLARTLSTLGDFKTAQHRMLADALQVLPIPTNRDMDDLYKEIYLLKKQVKQLSSKLETLGSSA